MREHEGFTPKDKWLSTQETSVVQVFASFDSEEPATQMAAIDTAMQHYFKAKDWIAKRNKVFPKMLRR